MTGPVGAHPEAHKGATLHPLSAIPDYTQTNGKEEGRKEGTQPNTSQTTASQPRDTTIEIYKFQIRVTDTIDTYYNYRPVKGGP